MRPSSTFGLMPYSTQVRDVGHTLYFASSSRSLLLPPLPTHLPVPSHPDSAPRSLSCQEGASLSSQEAVATPKVRKRKRIDYLRLVNLGKVSMEQGTVRPHRNPRRLKRKPVWKEMQRRPLRRLIPLLLTSQHPQWRPPERISPKPLGRMIFLPELLWLHRLSLSALRLPRLTSR